MLLLSLFFPLCGAILAGFFGRRLGHYGAPLLTIGALASALFIIILTLSSNEQVYYFDLFTWCHIGNFSLTIECIFDNLTCIMFIIVLTISLIVHIYSTQYLSNDPHLPRFISYLSFFTFFMLILVSAENFIQLFMGWEGVGLCSYLLINFWYTRLQANKSALKAVFVNKIGDIALLFAISLLYLIFGSTSFTIIFSLLPYVQSLTIFFFSYYHIVNFIAFFLLVGVIGKSAQIGLHVWLPDAMEGPTPVSALLHAATMVTAGIFLIIRCSFLFEHAPDILLLCLFIGSLTAFFAATTGLLQNDLKRIIAFSTCSQLGYMLVACSLSQYSLALFHLFNHAFFKALLFLAAGSVIHALNDEQDIRRMGGLFTVLPLTSTFFLIASLSLMGFPFLAGFYSKDVIIESTFTATPIAHTYASLLLILAALFTAAYSVRLFYHVFLTRPNFFFYNLKTLSDANLVTQLPLIILAILSIVSGYLFNDFFIGFGSTVFNHSIVVFPKQSLKIDNDFLPVYIKQLPFFVSVVGIITAYLFIKKVKLETFLNSNLLYFINQFLNYKWFFDKIYNSMALQFMKSLYLSFYVYLDKGIIEYIGPSGFFQLFIYVAQYLRQLQNGNISHYLFFVFTFLLIFLLIIQAFFSNYVGVPVLKYVYYIIFNKSKTEDFGFLLYKLLKVV